MLGLHQKGFGISFTIKRSLLIVTEPTATSLGTIELVLEPFSGVALAHRLTIRSKGSIQKQRPNITIDLI